MTPDKHRQVIAKYRRFFEESGIEPVEVPHDDFVTDEDTSLAHCHGMLDQMEAFIEEGRMDKVNRWLGFIQGVLWRSGYYSLEELKDTNRPESDGTE